MKSGDASSLAPDAERREAERFAVDMKLSLTTHTESGNTITTPASVENLSVVGALTHTRLHLQKGHDIMLAIPTHRCPDGLRLPGTFMGKATTVWVTRLPGGGCRAGLHFDEGLSHNIDFRTFVDFLQSRADNTSPC